MDSDQTYIPARIDAHQLRQFLNNLAGDISPDEVNGGEVLVQDLGFHLVGALLNTLAPPNIQVRTEFLVGISTAATKLLNTEH